LTALNTIKALLKTKDIAVPLHLFFKYVTMKKTISLLICVLIVTFGFCQTNVSDQNPNYAVSRTKYIAAKDSLIKYESSTIQNTYKAYDYIADLQERKDAKTAFKRELKLARAKNAIVSSGISPYYYSPYQSNYYYPYNSFGNNLQNFFYGALPWVGGYLIGKHW